MNFIDAFPHNKEFRKTATELLEPLDRNYTPEVRHIVNVLRSEGIPICSDRHGYWISDNPTEILKTVHSLENRMVAIAKATEGMYHYLIERGFTDGKRI